MHNLNKIQVFNSLKNIKNYEYIFMKIIYKFHISFKSLAEKKNKNFCYYYFYTLKIYTLLMKINL